MNVDSHVTVDRQRVRRSLFENTTRCEKTEWWYTTVFSSCEQKRSAPLSGYAARSDVFGRRRFTDVPTMHDTTFTTTEAQFQRSAKPIPSIPYVGYLIGNREIARLRSGNTGYSLHSLRFATRGTRAPASPPFYTSLLPHWREWREWEGVSAAPSRDFSIPFEKSRVGNGGNRLTGWSA